MLPLLLPIAADIAPVSADTTRFALSVSANGAPELASDQVGARTMNGARGGGSVAGTFYPWTPIIDDASPRSLQPFLQRSSFIELAGSGEYTSDRYPVTAEGGTYIQDFVSTSASTRYFFTPSVAVLGAGGLAYAHDDRAPVTALGRTRDLWQPSGTVGIDVRDGDASLTLQEVVTGTTESVKGTPAGTVPGVFWPRLTLAGRVVVRRVDFSAALGLIPDGESARVGVGVYPTRDLGLTLFAQFDRGQIHLDSVADYYRAQGGPGVTYWLSSHVSVGLSYAPQWIRSPNQDVTWNHQVTLGFTGRL